MGLRNVENPYGGPVPMVDKLIGTAYNVVRTVHDHLQEITQVAQNIDNIVAAGEAAPSFIIVANNMDDVKKVADMQAQIAQLAPVSQAIANVSAQLASVVNVDQNMSVVVAVAANLSQITAVYNNMLAITSVNNNAQNINTVAANIVALQAIYANLDAILAGEIYTADEKAKVAAMPTLFKFTGTSANAAGSGSNVNVAAAYAAGFPYSMVVSIAGSDGYDYLPGVGTFTISVYSKQLLVVTLDAAAPAAIVAKPITVRMQVAKEA